jgi:hypothetical protein
VIVIEQPVTQRVTGAAARFFFNCSSVMVSGPATGSPVTTLFGPRVPTPCCTAVTWRGYQLE